MSANNRLSQATDRNTTTMNQIGHSLLERGAELAHKNVALRQALGDITNIRPSTSVTKPVRPKLGERIVSRHTQSLSAIVEATSEDSAHKVDPTPAFVSSSLPCPIIDEESSPLRAMGCLIDEVTGSATKKQRVHASPSSRASRTADIVSLSSSGTAKALRALLNTSPPHPVAQAPVSLDDSADTSVRALAPDNEASSDNDSIMVLTRTSIDISRSPSASPNSVQPYLPIPVTEDTAPLGHEDPAPTASYAVSIPHAMPAALSVNGAAAAAEPTREDTITPTNAMVDGAGVTHSRLHPFGTIATFTTTAVREGAADSVTTPITSVDSRNRPSNDQPDVEGVLTVLYTLLPDIYSSLAQGEVRTAPHIDYFSTIQTGITAPNRAAVVDWMGEAAHELRLRNQTLLLGVTIMDRFLSVVVVSSGKLQLLALCALWIAAKFEEVHPPRIDAMLPLASNTYDRSHLLRVEPIVLSALGFGVACPTALEFLHCFAQNPYVPISGLGLTIAEFIIELCAQQPVYMQHRPSAIAASALFLARYILFSQGAQAQNLYRLQRLRDAYISYHAVLDAPMNTAVHPLFKSFLTVEPLADYIVEVAVEATWPLDLVAVTRYKLSTLAHCLNDVAAVLMYGMGYAAHARNPYREQQLPCLTEDTQELARLPLPLDFPPREVEMQFSCPDEPLVTLHCALREIDEDALPLPDALLLPYYYEVIRGHLPTEMRDADVTSRETFMAIPKEVRRLIMAHALSVDMRVPVPLNAFFGPGYAPTRSTYSRYASARYEHIAERFLPPFDLNLDTIITHAEKIEAVTFAGAVRNNPS